MTIPHPARRLAATLVAAALATTTTLARPLPATAQPTPLDGPFYSQFDPRWANVLVGFHQDVRMRTMGSLLTCIAMLAANFGLSPRVVVPGTGPDLLATPDYVHVFLRENNGYRTSPTKTVIIDYFGLREAFLTADGHIAGLVFIPSPWPEGRQIVDDALRVGEPRIIYTQPSPNRFHPLLVVGWDPDTSSYLVRDPAQSEFAVFPVPLRYLYGADWERLITGVLGTALRVTDDDGIVLFPLVTVSTKSPVEVAGVDPQGRRIGFDPATGATVTDLAGASYLPQPVWADPTEGLAPRAPGRLLTIPGAAEGRYRFSMIATGDGPFTLSVRAYDARRQMVVDESVVGTVTAGDVLKFQVEYANDAPSRFTTGDNFKPEAAAGGAQRTTVDGVVTFDGSRSFDIDGTLVAHAWDFGDGTTRSGAVVQHAYASAGVYTATLTVTDDRGVTATDTAEVAVYGDQALSGTTERVSLGPNGEEAIGDIGSFTPAISPDGRFVAFWSLARNLGHGLGGIFVRDRQTSTIESIRPPLCLGTENPQLSGDGRYIALECLIVDAASSASIKTIVVRDRLTGMDERVDVASDGDGGFCDILGICGSTWPAISEDGRFVAFYSEHANLVPGDTNGEADAFVHDRQTGTTERVSVATGGAEAATGTGDADRLGLSADGRFVAFGSRATDLVPGILFAAPRVYVRDRLQDVTELVSLSTTGTSQQAYEASISADGRFVAFESFSADLVPGDTNGGTDAFVRDRQTGTTMRVSVSGAGGEAACSRFFPCNRDPVISRDGRVVAFRSYASNLVLGDTFFEDVFVRDLVAGTTEIASVASDGTFGNGNSGEALFVGSPTRIAISADARFVAFSSDATNLVAADGNGIEDVFVRDRQTVAAIADPSGPYLGFANVAGRPAFVRFDASRSLDPRGHSLTARWDFGDGSPLVETPIDQPATHAYAEPGTYTVTLVVTDGDESSPPATTRAEIVPSRAPGIAVLPACGAPGDRLTVAIDGYPLVDAAGGWNLGTGPLPTIGSVHPGAGTRIVVSGPGGTLEDVVLIRAFAAGSPLGFSTQLDLTLAALAPGAYTLTAPDENGASAGFVVPCPALANEPPRASSGGPYAGTVGVPIVFDGRGSSDPESAPLQFEWFFEDGAMATGAQPAHAFAQPGMYYALLIVNDGELDSPTSVASGSYATVTVTGPGDPCAAVATGPTFPSLDCRLTAIRAATVARVATATLQAKLVSALDRARGAFEQARTECAARRTRKAKTQLGRLAPRLAEVARRLRSGPARKLVPESVRAELTATAVAMRADAKTLRRALQCPGDVSAP